MMNERVPREIVDTVSLSTSGVGSTALLQIPFTLQFANVNVKAII